MSSEASFFDDFVQAFTSFSGAAVASRYASPYMAMHADGTSDLHSTSDDTARYFQRVLDGYHAQGARTCSYEGLQVLGVGQAHVLATLTWTLWDAAGAAAGSWRESYVLVLRDGRYQITASIDH